MDQNEIGLKINVDNKSLNDLNAQLKDLTEKWKNVGVGTEEFKKLKTEIDGVNKAIKGAGAEIDNTGNLVSKLQGNIFSLVPGLSSVKEGFAALNTTMLEIAANPVLGTFIAISGALLILYDAFKNTKTGAKEIKLVMSEVNEISYQFKEILFIISQVIASVLIPVIKFVLSSLSSLIDYISDNKTMFIELGVVVGATAIVLNASAIATSALAVAQGIATAATTVFTAATSALAVAMNMTGIPEIVIAIAALVAIIIVAYNKSETFRGIVEGIIVVFKTWKETAKDVVDILGGIGKAIIGIITLDPAKIKEGLDQASDAGTRMGKRFQEGYQKGVDEVKKGKKTSGSSKADEAEDIQSRLNIVTKEGLDLDVEHTKVLADKDKALYMVRTNQKGATEALKAAEASEESYGKKVLNNKKTILDLAKENLKLKPEDKEATQKVRDAEKAYNETLSEGYRIKTKLGVLNKRENLQNKKEETKAQQKLHKSYKGKLQDLVNSHKKLIDEEKSHTEEMDDEVISAADDEIKFYKEHFKDMGITKEEADKHIIELEKKKSDAILEQSTIRIENEKKDLKAKDDLDVLNADNDDQKLAAQLKKLKDDNDEKLSNDKLTANERLLIQTQYQNAVDKLNSDYWDKKSKKELDDDKADLDRINKEEEYDKKHTKNKYDLINQLADLQNQKRQAELDQEQDKYDELLRLSKENSDDTTQIIKDHTDKINQINQEQTDSEIALSKNKKDAQLADMDAISNASTALSSLFGEQTVAAKGLAVSSAIINTFLGATKALSQGGIGGIAGAVAVIATGMVSVQKILSTPVPGGKSSSSGGSTPTITQFQAPQLMGIGGQKINNPKDYAAQRVYVTESDISKSQVRVKTIQNSAILGH